MSSTAPRRKSGPVNLFLRSSAHKWSAFERLRKSRSGLKLLLAVFIDFTPMTNLNHDNDKLFVLDLIDNPIDSLTHTVSLLG
jgi:hypothetical protein